MFEPQLIKCAFNKLLKHVWLSIELASYW